MRVFTLRAALCALALVLAVPAAAQSAAERAADAAISQDFVADGGTTYFSQGWLMDTIERRTSRSLDDVPRVTFDYYVVPQDHNRLQARLAIYNRFGDRDTVKPLLWLLNRNDLEDLSPGDTLVVPSHFNIDFRAYSPFPRYYPGGREVGKIAILDKSVQAWAAYENGELQRWGIINTGAESNRTPSGRFNVNWKQEYRVSSLSPPGEPWEMYWVMNLHEARGIHMHQYALPTSGPASHGCIRMLEPDAKWLYEWTDGWKVQGARTDISSIGARLLEQGTMVLIIGHDISGQPAPFVFREDHPVIRMVTLPASPWDVPPGSPQQQQFDRRRTTTASR